MTDALSRLLAVEALPRGERLARCYGSRAVVRLLDQSTLHSFWHRPEEIRRHARPLRLARERLREARAWERRAERAERALARLREKAWRADARARMENTVVRDASAAVFLDRAWLARTLRRKWEHGHFMERASAARIAMHAAVRGVPGSQPGWEG